MYNVGNVDNKFTEFFKNLHQSKQPILVK